MSYDLDRTLAFIFDDPTSTDLRENLNDLCAGVPEGIITAELVTKLVGVVAMQKSKFRSSTLLEIMDQLVRTYCVSFDNYLLSDKEKRLLYKKELRDIAEALLLAANFG
jgi:hypothetical protein